MSPKVQRVSGGHAALNVAASCPPTHTAQVVGKLGVSAEQRPPSEHCVIELQGHARQRAANT